MCVLCYLCAEERHIAKMNNTDVIHMIPGYKEIMYKCVSVLHEASRVEIFLKVCIFHSEVPSFIQLNEK